MFVKFLHFYHIKQLNMYDFVKIIFKVSNITSNLTHKMKTKQYQFCWNSSKI